MLIGYARVSTDEQNTTMQLNALRAIGCERIFCDEGISGAATDRRELNSALRALTAGDALVVWIDWAAAWRTSSRSQRVWKRKA